MALRRALRNLKGIVLRVVHDLISVAMRALLADHATAAAALIARNLRLSDHTRHDLLTDDADALTITRLTLVDVVRGCGAGPTTVVAEDALLDHEVDARASIDISERDFELACGGRPLAHLVCTIAAASEEALEHVERIRVVLLSAFVGLQTFFAMTVVDLPFGGIRKHLIGYIASAIHSKLRVL